MMWVIVGSVSALLIALLVFHNSRSPSEQSGLAVHPEPSNVLHSIEAPPPSVDEPLQSAYENLTTDATTTGSYIKLLEPSPKVDEEEDPRLRIFEEL
jgi:hypothetical protein